MLCIITYLYIHIIYIKNAQTYICKSPLLTKSIKTESTTGAPTVAFPFLTRFRRQIQN